MRLVDDIRSWPSPKLQHRARRHPGVSARRCRPTRSRPSTAEPGGGGRRRARMRDDGGGAGDPAVQGRARSALRRAGKNDLGRGRQQPSGAGSRRRWRSSRSGRSACLGADIAKGFRSVTTASPRSRCSCASTTIVGVTRRFGAQPTDTLLQATPIWQMSGWRSRQVIAAVREELRGGIAADGDNTATSSLRPSSTERTTRSPAWSCLRLGPIRAAIHAGGSPEACSRRWPSVRPAKRKALIVVPARGSGEVPAPLRPRDPTGISVYIPFMRHALVFSIISLLTFLAAVLPGDAADGGR